MKPDPIEQRDKKWLGMQRELNELYRHVDPSIKLDEPIQAGWRRRLVVKKKWKHHPHEGLFQKVINRFFATPQVSKRKDFLVRDVFGKWSETPYPNSFLTWRQWMESEFEPIERYFRHHIPGTWGCGICDPNSWNKRVEHWHFNNDNIEKLFDVIVEPHYHTHIWLIDGDVASRKHYLDNKLRTTKAGFRLTKLSGKALHCRCDYCTSKRPGLTKEKLRKEIAAALE